MIIFGWIVISAVLVSAVAGAIAACVDDEKGLGKEFLEGIYAIGYIFLPVAGIMASVPFLAAFIDAVFRPAFSLIGADPAMAATTFIAVDMGGYMLALKIAANNENWITAMTAGYMAGATIVFSIPVGLAMLRKRDHKYMALGVLAGLLAIPIGVLIANLLIWATGPSIAVGGGQTVPLNMSLPQILLNIAPLAVIMSVLALGLRIYPDLMIRLFMAFGRVVGILIKLVVVASIVEYFTLATFDIGLFTWIFGSWGFAPIIVRVGEVQELAKTTDAVQELHVYRALEVAGYIGIMLAGAFPMVYLIRKFLAKPVEAIGRRIGLDAIGAAGMLATIANILAMFRLVKDMRPRDKVLNISFAVCAAFLFGDHLAFTTNFQPNLLLPVMLGKLSGGICGFLIATWLCLPKARELEEADMILDAKAILQHVPSLKDKSLVITRIAGGMTNLIFKVDDLDASYVLRVFGAGTEQLGISREREVACSQAVTAIGVGPEVVAYLPEHRALLTRFVPGELLKDSDVQKPEVLRRIAETLKRCHAAPISDEIGTFSVFATIRDYLAKAEDQGVDLPREVGDARDLLHRVEKEANTDEPTRLCHNDLLAGNFIDDGSTMHIIDWEYGAAGDPFFDLGNFAVNLQMTEEQERTFLAGYFGEYRPEHLRRLRLMRLASDLREASWGFLQHAVSKLGAPKGYASYFAYGMKHLERFLTEAKRLGV